MIYRIPKGQQHAWPPAIGIHHNLKRMERIVVFNESARYDLPGTEDDEDVNKLFGFGYINGGHHRDSARFGWYYDGYNGMVVVCAYCYVNGARIIKELCPVSLDKEHLLSIDVIGRTYSFTVFNAHNLYLVYGGRDIDFTHKKEWSYKLGCFFGGNNPAPHEITIKMNKK